MRSNQLQRLHFKANELVSRMKQLKEVDVFNTWTMVIITIGTEEVNNVVWDF